MTHFTVMIKIPKCKNTSEAIDKLGKMLEPYSEELEVPEYRVRMSNEDVYRMYHNYIAKNLPDRPTDEEVVDALNKLNYNDVTILISKMDDWNGREGGIDEQGFYHLSTYNPNSKWDWYSIGGRWKGMLIPNKKGLELATGYEGESGVFGNDSMNDNGRDLIRADLIDFDKSGWVKDGVQTFFTHAVLDEHGWHEASKMGWWAITYDETEDEDTWRSKFKERWTTNLPKDTYIAIVDAHI